MSRESQFNFIPENLISGKTRIDKDLWYASVSNKYGFINLSKSYILQKNLNGKFLKFYSDSSKKAIAWRLFTAGSLEDIKGYRKVHLHANGSCKFSITNVVKSLNLKEESYNGLIIKNYKTTHSNLEGQIEYDYIKVEK